MRAITQDEGAPRLTALELEGRAKSNDAIVRDAWVRFMQMPETTTAGPMLPEHADSLCECLAERWPNLQPAVVRMLGRVGEREGVDTDDFGGGRPT